jgi:hypothetical protein
MLSTVDDVEQGECGRSDDDDDDVVVAAMPCKTRCLDAKHKVWQTDAVQGASRARFSAGSKSGVEEAENSIS